MFYSGIHDLQQNSAQLQGLAAACCARRNVHTEEERGFSPNPGRMQQAF
jgi:hypothetical protein